MSNAPRNQTRLSPHFDNSRQPIDLAALDLAEPPPPWHVVLGRLLRWTLSAIGFIGLVYLFGHAAMVVVFLGPLFLLALLFGH